METTGHFWVPLVLGGRRNRKQSSRRTAPFLGSTGASFCSQCPEMALSLWLAEDTTLTWWSAPWSSGDAAAPLQGHVRAHTCWVLFVGPQDPFLKKTHCTRASGAEHLKISHLDERSCTVSHSATKNVKLEKTNPNHTENQTLALPFPVLTMEPAPTAWEHSPGRKFKVIVSSATGGSNPVYLLWKSR